MKDFHRVSLPYSVYLDFCISCYSFALSNQCRAVYVEQKTALLPQLISFTVFTLIAKHDASFLTGKNQKSI